MIQSGYIGQRWHTFLLVALAVLGAALILLRNHPYGPAITRHSAVIAIGPVENLLDGKGWIMASGDPYHTLGPLYPALLALPGFLSGFGPRVVAGPLNALLFGLTIFTAGHWLRRRIASRWLALWGTLAIVFSPLTRMFDHAMAEPLFIFLTTAALFCMDRFLHEGRRAALIQAALFIVLACLTRNAGGLLVTSLGVLLLIRPGARPLEKMKHCAAFTLICGTLVSPWLLYGMLVTGDPLGPTAPPLNTMADFLTTAFSSFKGWITPGLPTEEAINLGAVLLAALATAFGFALVRRRPWHTFYLCGGLVLGFFILMGILAKITYLGGMGSVSRHWVGHRYWTPLYIPLLMALIFLMDRWLIWPRGKPIRLLSFRFTPREALLALLLFIWLGGALEINRQDIILASEGQNKYWANAEYVSDDALRFIREAPATGKISINRREMGASAFRDFVHYHTRRPIDGDDLHILPRSLEKLRRRVEAAAAGELLVWFHSADTPTPRPYSYGLAELDALPALERVASLSRGVVFRVKRPASS